VRAAAVAALAKFGLYALTVRPQVITLLRRCLHDSDDEVRDSATFYLALLDQRASPDSTRVLDPLDLPLENLEAALVGYLDTQSEQPFSLHAVPRELPKNRVNEAQNQASRNTSRDATSESTAAAVAASVTRMQTLFGRLGSLRASTLPEEITEREGAYTVRVGKHIYDRHLVLEYSVTNTIKEHSLRHVTVVLQAVNELKSPFVLRKVIAAPEVCYGDTVPVYAVLERPSPESEGSPLSLATQSFENHLKFNLHEIDDSGEVEIDGFPDEIALDDIQIRLSDYVRRSPISNWSEKWESFDEASQVTTTFGLATVISIRDGVTSLIKLLNLAPCEKSDLVEDDNKTKHILFLAGESVDSGSLILARVRMRWSPQQGVGMELTVRSPNSELNQALANVVFDTS
jgi:coatomer protein complex subunit gamma